MDKVLRGIPFVFVYTDDILVFSDDFEEHLQYLSLVFARLDNYELILKINAFLANQTLSFLAVPLIKTASSL